MDKPDLTVGVVMMNRLAESKPCWATLCGSTQAKRAQLLVVDNGSVDGSKEWVERYILPQFHSGRVIRNEKNAGVFRAMNQLWAETQTPILAALHNDLYVTEPGWDDRVRQAFAEEPRLGVAGFCGARGLAANGLRYDVWSNMLEAEIHGSRGWGRLWVSVLDGMALIMRRSMLDAVGGFDEGYVLHHRYDYDICLASLNAGFQNMLIGVACHHQSGLTASSPEYLKQAAEAAGVHEGMGDLTVHNANHDRYFAKWRHLFPRYV